MSTFGVSFAGIIGLFVLKYRESAKGAVYLPEWRARADAKAMMLKRRAERLRKDLELLPPIAAFLLRKLVHDAALLMAALARQGETQAYKLADLVSHKHRFERRAPRSEFLMRISEHKNHEHNTLAEDQDTRSS